MGDNKKIMEQLSTGVLRSWSEPHLVHLSGHSAKKTFDSSTETYVPPNSSGSLAS